MKPLSLPVLLLAAGMAAAAPLPFRLADGRTASAVLARGQRVRCDLPAWRVVDAYGRAIASGKRGGALPTGRYGAFRVTGSGGAPVGAPVSYAVIPDVAVRKTDLSSPFAMGGYFSMRYSPEDLPKAAELFRRMGATASRDELRWDLVEKTRRTWDFSGFDRGMIAQHDHHIEPLGLLDYWGSYTDENSRDPAKLKAHTPEAIAAFANYCRVMVHRYKPGGVLAQQRHWKDGWGVRHWEVWNEPATFWTGTPEQFGALLKAAYAAIKREDPKAVVHFSDIGPDWDRKALAVAGRSFDGVTPHYYSPPRSPDAADMDRQMRETVRFFRKGGKRVPIWVSEVGWDTNSQPEQEARQAQYLVRAYAMALDAGMDRVFWYNFRDDGEPGPEGRTPWFGVIRRDLTPKPSYAAYAAMVAELRGSRPEGRANLGSAVKAILFTTPGGAKALLWADRRNGSLALVAGVSWSDTMGNPAKGAIPLNDWPVYASAPGKSVAWLRKRLETAAIRGIPAVSVQPVQFVRGAGGERLLVRVENQSARSQTAFVTAKTGAAPGKRGATVLKPGAVATVAIPYTVRKPIPYHLMQPVALWVGTDQPVRRERVHGKLVETVQGTTKAVYTSAADPVIPVSQREAPTEEQFWASALYTTLATKGHVVGLVPWSPADLSVTAGVQYDETGLLLRFDVTDDVFHQTHTDAGIWQDDSVQVGIAVKGKDGKTVMHEFGYALTPAGPKAFRYNGPGAAGTVEIDQNGHHTVYDVRIPWPDLAPLAGTPGDKFRMDFMVNDNDGYGRRGWMELTPGIGTGSDPTRWLEWTLGRPVPILHG